MRTTRTPRARLLALGAVLALLVTACAGDDSDTTEDPDGAETTEDDGADLDEADDAADEGDDADDAPGEEATGDDADGGSLTVYSGRNEELVGHLFDDYTEETGVELDVRYGDTAELAATITEEGDASPADVYFAQDAGALGALQELGRFTYLPDDVIDQVDEAFRSRHGQWTGTSGRVRVLAYNTDELSEDEVPDSIMDLTEPEWEGRVGWAPTNGSFQAFVTALRVVEGDDAAREWLEAMIDNDAAEFENNTAIVEAVSRGEVEVGITNHYYLLRFLAEDPDFNVDNKYLPGDIGGLVNIAGMGVLLASDQQDAATDLVRYMLSDEVQEYFGQNADTVEFPIRGDIESPELPTLEEIDPPDVDLSDLEDLQGTLQLLQDVGALQ